MISADDWNKVQSEVSDDELEAATGGVGFKKKRIDGYPYPDSRTGIPDSRTGIEEAREQAREQWKRERKGHEFGDYIDL